MKFILLILIRIVSVSLCTAQEPGRISSGEGLPKAGVTNIYTYHPSGNILIPDKIRVMITYRNGEEEFSKIAPLNKTNNYYQFLFKAPSKTGILIIAIIEADKKMPDKNSVVAQKKTVFDNNRESGFIIHLYDKKGKPFPFENIDLAELLAGRAFYDLQLKKQPNSYLIKLYESAFARYPEFKQGDTYSTYLRLLYKENGDKIKTELLGYANKMKQHISEKSWKNAMTIYSLLKMDEEKTVLQSKILNTFPGGETAKQNYWDNYYNLKNPSEQSVLSDMHDYIAKFKDSSAEKIDRFYTQLVILFLDKKDFTNASKYEQLITDKLKLGYYYDYRAWNLSGKKIDTPGTDLVFAKLLLEKCLNYIKNPGIEYDTQTIQDAKNRFLDTYAFIFYKLGQYDSAFYYQDAIVKQGIEPDDGGVERYAAYAEKIKGLEFTQKFIESHLLTGIKSTVMIQQLQAIYKRLGLPEDEFKKLQEKSQLLVKRKIAESIRARYGSAKSKDFSLKNLHGEDVTLSAFKNKVVVLDFWATWCGPCLASFPIMKELINKYKNDSEVVFLFIDSWENTSPEKMQEAAVKIVRDHNYDFNVLLDTRNKARTDYKVQAIPARFVINKEGEIVNMGDDQGLPTSMGASVNDLSLIIEEAKEIIK